MVDFVVRARAAPVEAKAFRRAIGQGAGVEFLADITRNALFIAQGHRENTALHLVLEKSSDYSRAVSIAGNQLGTVANLHETALLELIATSLEAAGGLGKGDQVVTGQGVTVRALSFEHLVRDLALSRTTWLLNKRGQDIRNIDLTGDEVFVMTDHTPMPKKTFKSLARQGVQDLSIGPLTLHASQCITIIHNHLDRTP